MDYKGRFAKHIIDTYPNSEIASFIANDTENEFLTLCQKFLDIALNAPKVKTDNGELAGIFQFADINIAKNLTVEFIHSHNIHNTELLLETIESEYQQSGDPNDKRQQSGIVKEENMKEMVGYAGTLYFFTKISDDVFEKIKDEINTML